MLESEPPGISLWGAGWFVVIFGCIMAFLLILWLLSHQCPDISVVVCK